MKKQFTNIIIWGIALVLFVSACGTATDPTPNASEIATSAVLTVEARYTQLAATEQAAPTATTTPNAEMTEAAATLEPSPTVAVSQGGSGGSQTACYYAEFVGDMSIPDGTIMLPGTIFTKTWQIKNVGSCAWDTSHRLYLQSGDGMTTVTSFPLPRTVYPGDVINLSVEMTAPEAEGVYTGYWRIATPYGGSFGTGATDTSILAKITVSKRPKDAIAVTDVFYSLERDPKTGCPESGTRFIITATIVTNGPTTVRYYWQKYPDDGVRDGGKLVFTEAGRQTISYYWTLRPGQLSHERKMTIYVLEPNVKEFREGWIPFSFKCPE